MAISHDAPSTNSAPVSCSELAAGPENAGRKLRIQEISFVDAQLHQEIESLVNRHPIVLFMKGNRAFPQCGFSAKVVDILEKYVGSFETINVLEDQRLRAAVKEYAEWPTYPQLYVAGKFIGGADIVTELDQAGQLGSVLAEVEST